MKTKLLCIALVVFICLSVMFFGNWMFEKQNNAELESLCQYSAGRMRGRFADYGENGSEYDYHYGVSELVSFYNAYFHLTAESAGSTDSNCLHINLLLGELMKYPELSSEQINLMVSVAGMLLENVHDDNAHRLIFELYNTLVRD